MINIRQAHGGDIEVLARLGRITYVESHGSFITDKTDLSNYVEQSFSISKTAQNIQDSNNLFYLIYVNELPVGYAKLVLKVMHDGIVSPNNCRLERIYILEEFIPLNIGQQLLAFIEEKARNLKLDTIWLSVYIKNHRAIKFYEKNEFKPVGQLNFMVNVTAYDNIVFSKEL